MTVPESHTKGEHLHYTPRPRGHQRPVRHGPGQRRPPLQAVRLPRRREEPPAVTAARERHQALNAEIALRAALIVPDLEQPWEWYRELHDD